METIRPVISEIGSQTLHQFIRSEGGRVGPVIINPLLESAEGLKVGAADLTGVL